MRLFSLCGLALSVSLLASCQSTRPLAMTYRTHPGSAALFHGNTNRQIGIAPQAVDYTVSVAEQEQGYKMIPAVTARWVSGATATTDEIKVPLGSINPETGGYAKEFTIIRPADAPGAEIDASYHTDNVRNKLTDRQLQLQFEQN